MDREEDGVSLGDMRHRGCAGSAATAYIFLLTVSGCGGRVAEVAGDRGATTDATTSADAVSSSSADADPLSENVGPADGTGTTSLCNARTCAGCCDSSGTCQAGSSNALCGARGSSCANCLNQGAICRSTACGPIDPAPSSSSSGGGSSSGSSTCVPFNCPACVLGAACCLPGNGTCGCATTSSGPCL